MKKNSKRTPKKIVFGLIFLLVISFSAFSYRKLFAYAPIDVPLENQNDEKALGNGCEITALSMLLQFHNYNVNKNQLAEILDYVPLKIDENTYGNPHDGFVGNIYGGNNAMGVAIEPIEKVAKKIVNGKQTIIAKKDMPFSEIEKQIKKGNPVLVITTVDYVPPLNEDWQTWQTTSGPIRVCRLCHAAVVTGMNLDNVYVNDPYGDKNVPVSKNQFKKAFDSMGSQGLYLN